MKRNIVLIFQAAQLGNNIHPFVSSEVEAFCKEYDHVHLVCFDYSSIINDLDEFTNLTIHKVKKISAIGLINSIGNFFSCYGLKDMIVAFKQKLFSVGYIKSMLQVLLYGSSLACEASKVLKKVEQNEKWIVEGYWLTGPAFAAAWLKRKYPSIFAFARAHSSEIDFIRNPYCVCQFKGFINKFLDERYFISEWAKKSYEEIFSSSYGIENPKNNYVIRLGVTKKESKINKASSDGVFRILTCSRVVELKRLDLLANAISEYNYNKEIEWIHIGDGPDMDKVKKACGFFNKKFKAIFLGNMVNDDVHKFLAENPVDLFVNVSLYEGLPVSVMEAMAYGIPVLATDVGATREIVKDSNGFLIPVNIIEEELANVINKILSFDSDIYKVYRQNAYNTWLNFFNKDKNYKKLFERVNQKMI